MHQAEIGLSTRKWLYRIRDDIIPDIVNGLHAYAYLLLARANICACRIKLLFYNIIWVVFSAIKNVRDGVSMEHLDDFCSQNLLKERKTRRVSAP